MTTRNLNKTWFDILVSQYRQDHTDGVAHPIRYLLYNPQHKADLFYLVPRPVDPETFRESLINFNIYTRLRASPDFRDENITVWRRVKRSDAVYGAPGGEGVGWDDRRERQRQQQQQQQQQGLDDADDVEDTDSQRFF